MHTTAYRGRWLNLAVDDEPVITYAEEVHLAGLEGPQVQTWAMKKIEECMKRIRFLGTLYNGAAPINRTLPNEILMEIFGRLQPSVCQRGKGLKYLHVCRLWRQLLLAVPEFWAELLAKSRIVGVPMPQQQDDHLRFMIGLTGSRPITLSLSSGWPCFPLQLADILAPCHHRIVSLTLNNIHSNDGPFLNAFFRNELPLLEYLCVDYGDSQRSQDEPPLIDFKGALLPKLQFLKHPYGTIHLGDVGSQLRRLELFYSIPFKAGKDEPSTLNAIMACCTSLESLLLDDTLPNFEGALEHMRLKPPSTLRELRINDTHGDLLRNFIPYLYYPSTCLVDIECLDHGFTFARASNGLFRADSHLYGQLSTVDEIRLEASTLPGSRHSMVEARVGGTTCLRTRIAASAAPTNPASFLADFAAIFSTPFTKVTILCIDVTIGVTAGNVRYSFRKLLSAFCNLIRLDVRGCDGRHDIIPLLKESAGPSSEACACLRLEELRIDWLRAQDAAFSPTRTPSEFSQHDRFGPAVFGHFCDIVMRMLKRRKASGTPLKKMTVGVASDLDAYYLDDKRWDPPTLRQRFRRSLGQSLEEVDVVFSDR